MEVNQSYFLLSLVCWVYFPTPPLISMQIIPPQTPTLTQAQSRHKIINVRLQALFCCCVASERPHYQRCNYNQRIRKKWEKTVEGSEKPKKKKKKKNRQLLSPGPSLERETKARFCTNRNRLSRTADREEYDSAYIYSNRAISMTPLHFLKPWEKSVPAHKHIQASHWEPTLP